MVLPEDRILPSPTRSFNLVLEENRAAGSSAYVTGEVR